MRDKRDKIIMETKKIKKLVLTEKQQAYVNFIKKFWVKKGYGPTEQEIANHFFISTPSVHMMIVKLCNIGALTRTEGVSRSVRLPGHSGTPTKPPPGSWVYTGK
jgi:SOS-response transcriptional repressor LexA